MLARLALVGGMTGELIAVGTELVRHGRRDTNSEWLGERLLREGIRVTSRSCVEDETACIAASVGLAMRRTELLVLTGGLGPTDDDRTREALALALGVPIERDEEQVERLRRELERRGRTYRAPQAKQADRPRGARWIENPIGTAHGLWLPGPSCWIFALPGVPAEMKVMYEAGVRPILARRAGSSALLVRTLKVAGRTEASVDEQLRDCYRGEGIEVTILTGTEGIELRLLAEGSDETESRRRLDELDRRIAERLGLDLYGRDDETLPRVVGRLLEERGATLATAESCTAGLLAARITEVPGSSRWYRGGLVVYHDELKVHLAGVAREPLRRFGAVSEEVARELAQGARRRCEADYGIGVTGIAGPAGGSVAKPVGTVCIALAESQGSAAWTLQQFGDRELIRRRSVTAALDRLRRRLLRVAVEETS